MALLVYKINFWSDEALIDTPIVTLTRNLSDFVIAIKIYAVGLSEIMAGFIQEVGELLN